MTDPGYESFLHLSVEYSTLLLSVMIFFESMPADGAGSSMAYTACLLNWLEKGDLVHHSYTYYECMYLVSAREPATGRWGAES